MPANPALPTVGGDFGLWGDKLNAAATLISAEINTHEAATDPHGDRAYADTNKLDKGQNLTDLASPPSARTALGLGSAAQSNVSDFATPASVAALVAAAVAANRPVNL
jgi:hypothetical protein